MRSVRREAFTRHVGPTYLKSGRVFRVRISGPTVDASVVCVFSGITILLSLSVFQLIVAEMVPSTSMAVPLVGKSLLRVFSPHSGPILYGITCDNTVGSGKCQIRDRSD